MKTSRTAPSTIDEYILDFPPAVQRILRRMRQTIRRAAPAAEELISYQIPAFTLKGRLVYFAAFKNYIGFYPRASGILEFRRELCGYKGAKGSVQFPMDEPMPYRLIARIVKFRVRENLENAKAKRK